jgi:hypothetical protein
MTTNLQKVIDSAEQLSLVEQLALLNALSKRLYQRYQQENLTANQSFWEGQTLESILAQQNIPPITDISSLKADFWPEDESADDIIEFVEQERQADRTK